MHRRCGPGWMLWQESCLKGIIDGKYKRGWATLLWKWKLVAQSCLTLRPHGLSIEFSREEYWSGCQGSSWPRDPTWISCITGRFFTVWATREVILLWHILNIWCSHKKKIGFPICYRTQNSDVSYFGNMFLCFFPEVLINRASNLIQIWVIISVCIVCLKRGKKWRVTEENYCYWQLLSAPNWF